MDRDGNTTPGGLKSPSFSPFSPGTRRRASSRSSLPPQVTPPAGLRWRQSPRVSETDRDQASPFLDPTPEMREEQRKLVERHFIDEGNSPFLDHPTTEPEGSSFSQPLARRKPRSAPKLTDFFNESETRRRVEEDPFADDSMAGRGMHSPLSNFSLRRIPMSQPLIDHTIPSHQPEHTVMAHRSEFTRTQSSGSLQMSSHEFSQKFSQNSDIAPSQEMGEPGSKWKGYYDYKSLRQRIKDYENSFQASQGRKPKVDDINGDASLVKMYKDYKKSKKAFEAYQAGEKRAGSSAASSSFESSSKAQELLKTPTKSSRTRDAIMRTPTKESRTHDDALFKTPTMPSRTRDAVFKTPTMGSRTRDVMATTPTRGSSFAATSPFKSPAMSFRTIRALSPVMEKAGMSKTEALLRTPTRATSKADVLLRTPTKQRGGQTPTGSPVLMKTPTGMQAVEFVSPRKVINRAGFMSPGRKTKESEDRFQYLTAISGTTPTSQRTRRSSLLSPSGGSSSFAPTTPNPPTPGSAQSDVSLLRVPAGFNSYNRRRLVKPAPFMASQEDDEQFEREFLQGKPNAPTYTDLSRPTAESGSQSKAVTATASLSQEDSALGDDLGYDVDYAPFSGEEDNPFMANTTTTAPKKKYTQKRSTRLHKIAVAPSEKSVEKEEKSKASTRAEKAAGKAEKAKSTKVVRASRRKAPTAVSNSEGYISEGIAECIEADTSTVAPEEETAMADSSATLEKDLAGPKSNDPLASGWANSNKPMVKSDRRMMPGRAGAKKPSSNYSGGGPDGNFVAYNLQRGGGFKKGGFGKGRFGQRGAFGAGAGPTGRTAFDPDQWREEFDKDLQDTGIPSNLDLTGLGRDEVIVLESPSESGLPWYGNVDDEDDPYVVAISPKYTQQQFGDRNDPEEFVKELELQENPVGAEGYHSRSNEFRVNVQHVLHQVWGYPAFRDGQFEAIKRVLTGQSSLLVLPTGSGKSLSYQLPAYIFSKLGIPSLALVISPMISLMQDQVKCLPRELKGAAWTSIEQTTAQFKAFMENLTSNTIKILFISPEKLQTPSFLGLVRTRAIPRISFVCVDEVHCMSEWSHNFRPAYLLLNHVLKTDLNSPCVLGLTGTATEGTKDSICQMLDIDRMNGVLSGPVIRENLVMTVSLEIDRQTALLNLLQSPRFESMESILIYVMKKKEADDLSAFLRVRNFSAESYHAGKSSEDRQRIQSRFMYFSQDAATGAMDEDGKKKGVKSSGGIRILCATIAFGLGLNKSNIRSVIHFCMPKSIENYIQEIGRSGRDGKKSFCHMFLVKDDYLRLRSWAYADGMDYGSVFRLVRKLFSRKDLGTTHRTTASISRTTTSSSLTERLNAAAKAKKRKSSRGVQDDDCSGPDDVSSDDLSQTGNKKRKRNDAGALSVKSKSSQPSPTDLIMSSSSIVAIAPSTHFGKQDEPRIVVVRQDLAMQEFDIKSEVMATLLSYIELDESESIKVMGSVSAKCTVKFLKESDALSQLADELPLMDMILKQGMLTGYQTSSASSSYGRNNKRKNTSTLSAAYCCSTMSLCQQMDISFTELTQELQRWKYKKWAVFEMSEPSLCVQILKEPADCIPAARIIIQRRLRNTVDEDEEARVHKDSRNADEYENDHDIFIKDLSDRLHKKMCAVERVGVAKVDQVHELFRSVATPTWQEQGVFQQGLYVAEEDDFEQEDEDLGAESSEYDEDVDPAYIQSRAKAKVEARLRSAARSKRPPSQGVTEAELVLRRGIQEYFDRQSGEGIGGIHAEEELFANPRMDADNKELRDKTLRLYTYENSTVMEMQRQWRSAAEIDLKVFLSQQWQQAQQSGASGPGGTGMGMAIDSPRVVSRIFHGVDSPCYPALEWYKNKYWGKLFHFDFSQLMLMADAILKDMRRRRANLPQRGSEEDNN
ncbi:ATP-dependent DNA helicase Q4 [Entomortierella parvispora]|uniref:DNA 3'-5' helicase n=1 Tax=Entomortierella parvispora TaxID=205924 RepID=A0A9P3HDW6_9FUNG|nr:ATP-dependent DNA helicase Q4 [Entomortierella parvispora]